MGNGPLSKPSLDAGVEESSGSSPSRRAELQLSSPRTRALWPKRTSQYSEDSRRASERDELCLTNKWRVVNAPSAAHRSKPQAALGV